MSTIDSDAPIPWGGRSSGFAVRPCETTILGRAGRLGESGSRPATVLMRLAADCGRGGC